ncbi:MAG: hypothetical protein HC887_02880 [Desulfobacteraceae bacterium]|nr:hypothetical protein [Desulfobacteraceae bacterium]
MEILGGGGDKQEDRSYIDNNAYSSGHGGKMQIRASDYVLIDGNSGYPSSINSISLTEKAGDIDIETPALMLRNSALIQATTYQGQAGDIEIKTDRLDINGGSISSAFAGPIPQDVIDYHAQTNNVIIQPPSEKGKAGNISITAKDSILIGGKINWLEAGNYEFPYSQSLLSSIDSLVVEGECEPGSITLRTGNLLISKGQIAAGIRNGLNAGEIKIDADSVEIKDKGAINTSTIGSGHSGNININSDKMLIYDGGIIAAQTSSKGDAGNIDIQVNQIELANGRISTSSRNKDASGNGGSISISATESVSVNKESLIESITIGHGNAGTIDISTPNLFVRGGKISCLTGGEGHAGDHTTGQKIKEHNL